MYICIRIDQGWNYFDKNVVCSKTAILVENGVLDDAENDIFDEIKFCVRYILDYLI